MRHLLFFIAAIFVSYGIGSIILRLFIKEPENTIENFVFSTGLGLALLAYTVYAIGSMGLLYRAYVLPAFSVLGIVAIYPCYRFLRKLGGICLLGGISNMVRSEKFLAGVILVVPAITLFGAMAPAIGNDALAYHLHHSGIFVERGFIGVIPFTRESLWPYLGQMLFTLGLLFESVTFAKLSHYFFGILLVISVFSFARRFFSKKTALLAAALLVSAPGIFTQMMYAYVDLPQGFYSFMALYSVFLWAKKEKTGFLALSGVFSGLSLGVKLMSGISVIALIPIILIASFHKKISIKKLSSGLFIFGSSAFIAGSVWYLRSYLVLGNPVYPFMHNVFGAGWETNINIDVGISRDIIGFIRLPWDVVMNVDSFGGEQIGVIFLAFFPMLLFLPLKDRNIRYLLIFFIVHAGIWLVVSPMMRFTYVNFAVGFILISIGFERFSRMYHAVFLKYLLAICICFDLLLCLYHNIDPIAYASGRMTSDEYLTKKERTFPVADFVNKNTPADSTLIILGDSRGFYFERETINYSMWQRQTGGNVSDLVDSVEGPLYIIHRDDASIEVLGTVLNGIEPIFTMEREVDRGVKAVYSVFQVRE